MEIVITQGRGSGRTTASAFDAALLDAGIGDFTLVRTAGAIPPGSLVTPARYIPTPGRWGNRLYVVVASALAVEHEDEVWAGLGWMQARDGRGLLARHTDPSRENVVNEIEAALHDMAAVRREKFGPVRYVLQEAVCDGKPACGVVAAVFRSEGWKNGAADSPLSH